MTAVTEPRVEPTVREEAVTMANQRVVGRGRMYLRMVVMRERRKDFGIVWQCPFLRVWKGLLWLLIQQV